jgi:hypothetical protein
MARLMERMGRPREAEEHYRRIQERYNSGAELVGFYYRLARVDKDASYETRLRDALALALPPGLEPFDSASLPASPKDGVVVKSVNDNTKRFGIMWGNGSSPPTASRARLRRLQPHQALSQSPKMARIRRGEATTDRRRAMDGIPDRHGHVCRPQGARRRKIDDVFDRRDLLARFVRGKQPHGLTPERAQCIDAAIHSADPCADRRIAQVVLPRVARRKVPDEKGASLGPSPARPRGGDTALAHASWSPRRASSGVAPWSP